MDQIPLVSSMSLPHQHIQAGRHLVNALDRAGFPMTAAYWVADRDSGIWQLVISTPLYDHEGPIESYTRLGKILESMATESRIDARQVYLQGTKDRLTQAISHDFAFGTATEDATLEETWIGDRSISAAYLYHLSTP